MRAKLFYIILLSTLLIEAGCTEQFEIESNGYESVLVVESTITDEMKPQVVKLSRTSTLDTNAVIFEYNASVNVTASDGQTFRFSQDYETGYYLSDRKFSAQPNVSYTLEINTENGRSYSSSPVIMPPVVGLDEVYAERIIDANQDQDGIQVLVNTKDPTGLAKYFRYEYEETYKIVAPYPSPFTFEIVNYTPEPLSYDIDVTRREPEEICYSTELSSGIKQVATTDLNENRVFRFPVKYLSKSDAKVQSRYSILVKQYVQSVEAYTFYKILKELGSVGSILSQGQPGYVSGNVISNTNLKEKVLGFFEASPTVSKRIYFDYTNFGIEKPPYFVDCEVFSFDYWDNTILDNDPDERNALFTSLKYFDYQIISVSTTGIYRIVQPECSVCTYFSSNVKPDFWED